MSEYVCERWDEVDDWIVREEIVRCRDCAHYELLEGERGDWCQYWTDKVYGDGDGFCKWGERK